MSGAPPTTGLPTRRAGFAFAGATVLHAAVFGYAAWQAPSQAGSWFAFSAGGLAALHLGASLVAVARRERAFFWATRALAAASLAFLGAASWVVLASALYLVVLYRSVGQAFAFGLFSAWAVVVLFTAPIGVWCWVLARALRPSVRARAAVAASSLLVVASLTAVAASARSRPALEALELERIESGLEAAFEKPAAALRGEGTGVSLLHTSPAICPGPVDEEALTLFATFVGRAGKPLGLCVQAPTGDVLVGALRARLRAEGLDATARVKLDLVSATHRLRRIYAPLDAFKLRPALDGVCSAVRCFAPWQLVALDAFRSHQPLEGVRDARFGTSLDYLAHALGDSRASLVRVETRSLLADADGLHRLWRGHAAPSRVDPKALRRAVRRAASHIVAQQSENGTFSYELDPFRGSVSSDVGNIARQAGTALVLCELGDKRARTVAARRALSGLAAHAVPVGDALALSLPGPRARLTHSTLSLAAYVTCRDRVGERGDPPLADYDSLIGGLARFVLLLQRPDGSFHEDLELSQGTPGGRQESLYGPGQAVLALVLLDELARREPNPAFPSADSLHRAIERAMDHYANEHWPRALRSLFFAEENWHCIAARAALRSHRHDGYERFCLDYVAYKSRFVLGPDDVDDRALVGGYTVSPVFPPHVTSSAGFGEAMAAAIAVRRARKLPVAAERALLERALAFLVSQQWDEVACFACTGPDMLGSFSQSAASSLVRTDYVQHSLAALGHGARALEDG